MKSTTPPVDATEDENPTASPAAIETEQPENPTTPSTVEEAKSEQDKVEEFKHAIEEALEEGEIEEGEIAE